MSRFVHLVICYLIPLGEQPAHVALDACARHSRHSRLARAFPDDNPQLSCDAN